MNMAESFDKFYIKTRIKKIQTCFMLSITTALQHRLSYKQRCMYAWRVCVPKRIKEKSKKDKEERKKTQSL